MLAKEEVGSVDARVIGYLLDASSMHLGLIEAKSMPIKKNVLSRLVTC